MTFPQLGRFEILEVAGQGAMGVVYRARDPLIERIVAIKTVACSGISKAEAEAFEQRFYREAKSAGRLNHQNIVTIHDAGKSGDLAYIAMEFMSGSSLRDVLDSGIVLGIEQIIDWTAQVADGLAFAHANGVVHRDIKPGNIMVLDNRLAKIADFGVAQLPMGSLTLAGTVFGSPKYMSPEQVKGGKVDGRTDIFSLGVVLYEMLTGVPPFQGEDINAVFYQVLSVEPPPPSQRRRNLPPSLDRIVARAMAKDPAQRYADASEMALDLRRCRAELRQAAPEPDKPAPKQEASEPPRTLPSTAEAAATVPLVAAPPGKTGRAAVLVGALIVVAGLIWLVRPGAGTAPTVEPPAPAAASEAAKAATPAPATSTASSTPAPVSAAATEAPPATAAGTEGKDAAPSTQVVRVRLAISPWGEVFVEGKREGVSPPLTELQLPPGKHRIEIRNPGFTPYRINLELNPESNARIKHKFQ